jgi:hypothetical protein
MKVIVWHFKLLFNHAKCHWSAFEATAKSTTIFNTSPQSFLHLANAGWFSSQAQLVLVVSPSPIFWGSLLQTSLSAVQQSIIFLPRSKFPWKNYASLVCLPRALSSLAPPHVSFKLRTLTFLDFTPCAMYIKKGVSSSYVSHLPLEISHCVIKFKDGGVEEIAACWSGGRASLWQLAPIENIKVGKWWARHKMCGPDVRARTCVNRSVDVVLFYNDVCLWQILV